MPRSICIMYSKYSRAKVCGFEFAIIIFRIKPCYTFGHTKRLSSLFLSRRRSRCTERETGCEICIIQRGTFIKSTRGPRSRAKDIYISLYSQKMRRKRTKTSHFCREERKIFSHACVSHFLISPFSSFPFFSLTE